MQLNVCPPEADQKIAQRLFCGVQPPFSSLGTALRDAHCEIT